MKPTQRLRYAERIERVLRHLETCDLDDYPSVPDLARIAALSEFHFHRIYRVMTGEPIGAAVRRIRLARSIPALAAGTSVTSAAIDVGYQTPQAYARALRAQTGRSPTDAQSDPVRVAEQLRRATQRQAPADMPAVTVEIASIAPFRLLAIRNTGAYAELNSSYARLFELVMMQVDAQDIAGIYCVQLDDARDTPAGECRAICALDVGGQAPVSPELESLELGGFAYAKLRHYGNYDLIDASIDRLYAAVIDSAELEPAAAPLYIHYLDDPELVAEHELRSDLYLPVQYVEGIAK